MLRVGTIGQDVRPLLAPLLAALADGVRTVHVIDARVAHALLLDVLTSEGVGTMIRSDAGPDFHTDTRRYFSPSGDGVQAQPPSSP